MNSFVRNFLVLTKFLAVDINVADLLNRSI